MLEQFFQTSILISVAAATVRIATPLLLAALGELVAERSGVYNMGLEGMMLMGALTGYLAAYSSGSLWVGVAAAGLTGAPFHVAYGAAKAGVVALTRTMAVEWGPYGIRTNVIAPGTINTPRAKPMPPDRRDRVAIPLHRRGEPRRSCCGWRSSPW